MTNEEIHKGLYEGGLAVIGNEEDGLHGEIVFVGDWSRMCVYLSEDGQTWGVFFEDEFISEEAGDEIVRIVQGVRRGKPADRENFPSLGKPHFVIEREIPRVALATFSTIVRVLGADDSGRRARRVSKI